MQQNKKNYSRPNSAYNSTTTTIKIPLNKNKKRPISATTPASINRLHSTQTRHSSSHNQLLHSNHNSIENNNNHHHQNSNNYNHQNNSYNYNQSPNRSSSHHNSTHHYNNITMTNSYHNSHHNSYHNSSHLTQHHSTLSPTHREVYKRLIIDAVQTINCPILYRTLLKLEKAFQPDQRTKQRFAKMVYLSACQGDQDYDPLVDFLKSQMGVCISLAECRQLVLYSGLFGDTSSPNPPKENMKQVVTNMHLHVPQLFYYHKWCRDVKRLETKMHKPTTGYFSNKWKNSNNSNLISPDLSSVITTNSDDHSRHSNQSLERILSFQSKHEDDKNKHSSEEQQATSSRHLAMLQAIANGEDDDDEFIPPPPKPKGINRFKKIALSLVAVGSDLSLLNDTSITDPRQQPTQNQNQLQNQQQLTQSSTHTPFQINSAKRKTGQSNVYMLSDTPEYRKLVANLARGDSTVAPNGEILNSTKENGENEWNFFSIKDSYDGDEGAGSFLPSMGPSNSAMGGGSKNELISILNMKGDPIKDGYYVDAASRVEVLNFLDPNYYNNNNNNSGSITQRNGNSDNNIITRRAQSFDNESNKIKPSQQLQQNNITTTTTTTAVTSNSPQLEITQQPVEPEVNDPASGILIV